MTAGPAGVGLPPLREVIARYGLNASKALGQNFLFDGQLLARIAAVPGDLAGAEVLEVGPGPGGLTRALLAAGASVTAIERDARCIPALEELGAAYPGGLRLIEGDALAVDAPALFAGRPHIVSNLPYNVGTALLVGWLTADWQPWWQSLTLMFQKEVAERIVAAAGSNAYGRLAVLAQWRTTARIAMPVHRSAFTPPPKVMSAVVHLRPEAAPAGVDVKVLERLTAAAFGQRRKMLRQSLKGVPGALDGLERIGIDATRRAETLDVTSFADLAREVGAARGDRGPRLRALFLADRRLGLDLCRRHRRALGDRRRQLVRLRASGLAQGTDLGEVAARDGHGALGDQRLALPAQRDDVVGLQRQRLTVQADRLARQAARLGDLRQHDEGGAVARIDRHRGFQNVGRTVQIAGGARGPSLGEQLQRARVDLIVRPLPAQRGGDADQGQRSGNGDGRNAHEGLHRGHRRKD
jgi:16S rRNA (adenine1518-N6/adenine1519-N6)-dimethyltransferase